MTDQDGRIDSGLACEQCGRRDQPGANNRCKGCGALHWPSEKLDISTFASTEPEWMWVRTIGP